MPAAEHVTHDGIVAFWLLTGGAWAVEEPKTHPLQENCRMALDGLLSEAVARGVPRKVCAELMACLRTEPKGERAMVLAVLIASEIPDAVSDRITDAYLGEHAAMAGEPTAEQLQSLASLAEMSDFSASQRH